MGEEIDQAFEEGRLEKKFAFSSILLNTPTKNEIINSPRNLMKMVSYISTYKNVKTITDFENKKYDDEVDAYRIVNLDSHTIEMIFEKTIKNIK